MEISLAAFVNPAGIQPCSSCVTSVETELGTKKTWWFTIGEAKPHPEEGWEISGCGVRCGQGSLEPAASKSSSPPAGPHAMVEITTFARLTPEGVVQLDLSSANQVLTGFSDTGEPVYERSASSRTFYFPGGGEAFYPLITAKSAGKSATVPEALLHAEARLSRNEAPAAFGSVWLDSDLRGAEVRVDGGLVGRIPDSGELIVGNLLPGDREVRLRDGSGFTLWRWVRVVEDRTVPLTLRRAATEPAASTYGLNPMGKNPQGYEEYRRARDGAVVVKIPVGEFLMGNHKTERQPLEHRVVLSEYMIDKTAVSWRQYKRFAAATETPLPPDWPYWGIHDDHPAVFVTWDEAKAFCLWAGGRLPTEAEREKAARGTDDRSYPWGNEEPSAELAVFRRNWGHVATDPVDAHPTGASPYGLLNMGGNVWEWCEDWYDDKYYEQSPSHDPRGPATGIARVVRGGSWDSRPAVLSCSCRNFGARGYREGDFGFRCAMNAPSPSVKLPQAP